MRDVSARLDRIKETISKVTCEAQTNSSHDVTRQKGCLEKKCYTFLSQRIRFEVEL